MGFSWVAGGLVTFNVAPLLVEDMAVVFELLTLILPSCYRCLSDGTLYRCNSGLENDSHD